MLETDELRLAEVQAIRRGILRILHLSQPFGANEKTISNSLLGGGFILLPGEARGHLEYLDNLKAIEILDRDRATWAAKILPYGVDIVEFAVKAPAGIAKE
ncbi:MAG: hypothetical protein WDA26_04835 [Pusillimonas sp.]